MTDFEIVEKSDFKMSVKDNFERIMKADFKMEHICTIKKAHVSKPLCQQNNPICSIAL